MQESGGIVVDYSQVPLVTIKADGSIRYLLEIDAHNTTVWRRLFWVIKCPWVVIEFIIKGSTKL